MEGLLELDPDLEPGLGLEEEEGLVGNIALMGRRGRDQSRSVRLRIGGNLCRDNRHDGSVL